MGILQNRNNTEIYNISYIIYPTCLDISICHPTKQKQHRHISYIIYHISNMSGCINLSSYKTETTQKYIIYHLSYIQHVWIYQSVILQEQHKKYISHHTKIEI